MQQQTQPLSSAARMRLTRERRRDGMRVVPLEARDMEIDGLIRCGLLRHHVATATTLDGLCDFRHVRYMFYRSRPL
jgi:hypothetical protein